MKNNIYLLTTFILGILFAVSATFVMVFTELLPLSITLLIVGIVLISGSPVLAIRKK